MTDHLSLLQPKGSGTPQADSRCTLHAPATTKVHKVFVPLVDMSKPTHVKLQYRQFITDSSYEPIANASNYSKSTDKDVHNATQHNTTGIQ